MVIAADPGITVRSATALATVGARLRSAAATSTASTAPGAITMPAPESRSTPSASMSRAAPVIPVRSRASVRRAGPPAASSSRAPIAAACGAAADVPQKYEKPGVAVDTHVAAARSGFCSTFPPFDEKSPGVIAVPSDSKKTRRGPVRAVRLHGLRAVEEAAGVIHVDCRDADGVLRRRVAPHVAGGRDIEPPAEGLEAQVAVRAGGLDDHREGVLHDGLRGEDLDRVLRAVLHVRRARQHVSVGVHQEQVVVVRRRPQRIGPLEDELTEGDPGHRVRLDARAEVVPDAERLAVHDQGGSSGVVALPGAGRAVVQVAVVAARGKEEAAVRDRRVDALDHDAVLQVRLVQVPDVVDDDVRPRLAQRLDVLGEPRLPARRGREVQIGARREVVHDLEHRRPLVAAPRLPRQHRHVLRQVARALPVGERADAVGHDADPDAGAVDAVRAARLAHAVGGVALGRIVLAGHLLVGGADGPHGVERGEPLHGDEREPRPDGSVPRHAVDDAAAQLPDARQDGRCHLGPDVHQQAVVFHLRFLRGRAGGPGVRR